jgi:hypothetical protein
LFQGLISSHGFKFQNHREDFLSVFGNDHQIRSTKPAFAIG